VVVRRRRNGADPAADAAPGTVLPCLPYRDQVATRGPGASV